MPQMPFLKLVEGEQAPRCRNHEPARNLALCPLSDAGAIRDATVWHSYGLSCSCGWDEEQIIKREGKYRRRGESKRVKIRKQFLCCIRDRLLDSEIYCSMVHRNYPWGYIYWISSPFPVPARFVTQLWHCDDNANEKSDSDDAEREEDVLVPQRNGIPEPVPPLLHLVDPLVLKFVHQSALFHLDQVMAEEFQKLWVAIQ